MIGGNLVAAVAFDAADPDIQAASKAMAANAYYHIRSYMTTCDHACKAKNALVAISHRSGCDLTPLGPKHVIWL